MTNKRIHMLSIEKEKLVIDLYYNQRKNVRQIAQEARISFRDIAAIIKKKEVAAHGGNGNGNNNKYYSHSNEKTTQAYKLFSEGKKPVQVAIELGLREKQVDKLYREYSKLKNLNELYEIYPQIEHCLPSFLKLHKALKKRGLNPNNVEWFANAIETGAIKIPEIQKQYVKIQDEIEAIDYKKTLAKSQLDDMNNRISYLNKIAYNKRNEIAYLKVGSQGLEEYVHGLKNHNQQQQELQNE